jgi:hypothetical protein
VCSVEEGLVHNAFISDALVFEPVPQGLQPAKARENGFELR